MNKILNANYTDNIFNFYINGEELNQFDYAYRISYLPRKCISYIHGCSMQLKGIITIFLSDLCHDNICIDIHAFMWHINILIRNKIAEKIEVFFRSESSSLLSRRRFLAKTNCYALLIEIINNAMVR